MTILIAGLVVFFGIHVVPMFPDFKGSLQSRFGEMRFKGIYSLVSLTGFALILLGMSSAEFRPHRNLWREQVGTRTSPSVWRKFSRLINGRL